MKLGYILRKYFITLGYSKASKINYFPDYIISP